VVLNGLKRLQRSGGLNAGRCHRRTVELTTARLWQRKGKAMNYISFLQDKTEAQGTAIAETITALSDLMHYLESSKFQGPDNDYVHVKTDIFPKLREIRLNLLR
jgi:hypothetical protein